MASPHVRWCCAKCGEQAASTIPALRCPVVFFACRVTLRAHHRRAARERERARALAWPTRATRLAGDCGGKSSQVKKKKLQVDDDPSPQPGRISCPSRGEGS